MSEDIGGVLDAAGVSNRIQNSPNFAHDEPRPAEGTTVVNSTAETAGPAPRTPTQNMPSHDDPLSYCDATPALEAYWSALAQDGELPAPTTTGPLPQAISTPRAGRSLLDRNPWALLHNSPGSPISPSPRNPYVRIPELQLHGRTRAVEREQNTGGGNSTNASLTRYDNKLSHRPTAHFQTCS